MANFGAAKTGWPAIGWLRRVVAPGPAGLGSLAVNRALAHALLCFALLCFALLSLCFRSALLCSSLGKGCPSWLATLTSMIPADFRYWPVARQLFSSKSQLVGGSASGASCIMHQRPTCTNIIDRQNQCWPLRKRPSWLLQLVWRLGREGEAFLCLLPKRPALGLWGRHGVRAFWLL